MVVNLIGSLSFIYTNTISILLLHLDYTQRNSFGKNIRHSNHFPNETGLPGVLGVVSPGGDAEEAWAKRAQHEKQQGGENSGMSEGIKEPFFLGQDELVFLSRQRTQPLGPDPNSRPREG